MLDDVREAALRLLDYQDRSAGELRDRLLKKSFREDEIEEVISSLADCGILDDRRFASFFAQSKFASGKGRVYIINKLKEKKISSSVIQDVMEELMEEENESILCLRKALSLCGLSQRFETDDSGEIVPAFSWDISPESELETETVGYFEPSDEKIRRDRKACYAHREKEKAKLTRRLISAGFPPGIVFETVRKIERL